MQHQRIDSLSSNQGSDRCTSVAVTQPYTKMFIRGLARAYIDSLPLVTSVVSFFCLLTLVTLNLICNEAIILICVGLGHSLETFGLLTSVE